ncbi:hypothetical protein J2Y74_002534 [Pseudomonas migulae]|uniref:hypothetical protein n=1 Tax=Pseudomonas migulae TaxID=78543 RepID=UPI00209D9FF7|nr:hypothetical protein [Pseudomonas migulae]MCP1518224.1 hypothetical protein [Pseudomonas migulae]
MTIQIKSGLSGIQPVYICYGAPSHTLRIKSAEESPWVGHGASLNHAAGDLSLVTAEPGYGELQTLRAEGAEWKLICPANGMDRDFEYWFQSEFTAEPCKIPMRLGHYRREILGSLGPISAPVKGDTVKAEIKVCSYYTKQVLEGIEVKWSIDGTTVTVPTTASGVSHFTHTVQTLGEQTITAEFHSPYDDKTVKESFEINVYETSPWKEAKLFVNEAEVKWGDPIVLTRGSANAVRVDVAPEIAKVLRLGVGEDGGLNLVSNPPFDSSVSPVGETFTWTVTPDDGLSGLVTLVIFSPDVERPWELPCWVMSADLADEVDEILVGGVVSPSDGVVFFRNEPQTVTVTYKPGSPLQSYPLKLTGTPLTGVQPGDLVVTPGNGHTWSVAASNRSGTFKLELEGVGFAQGITLPVSKVLSRILADEVTVQIDGQDAVAGSTYFRGGVHTLTLVPKPDSPIAGYMIGLWLGRSPLVICNPPPETFTERHTWTITLATDTSGLFHFELAAEHFGGGNIKIEANKLLSRSLADEVTVQIDGKDAVAGSTYFRSEEHTLTLVPKPDSPIAAHRVGLFLGGSPLVTCDPPAETFTGVHTWKVMLATDKSGLFHFELAGEHFGGGNIKFDANKLLSRDLGDEVTVLLDGVAIPSSGADFTGGQTKTLTLSYKTPNVLIDVPLAVAFVPVTGLVASDLLSQPRYSEFTLTHQWKLIGALNKSGAFKLKFFTDAEMATMLTPTNRLSTSGYKIRFLALELPGGYVELPSSPVETRMVAGVFAATVRVTELDNSPIEGVSVTLDSGYTGVTNGNGIMSVITGFAPGTYDYSAVATRVGTDYKETIRLKVVLPT